MSEAMNEPRVVRPPPADGRRVRVDPAQGMHYTRRDGRWTPRTYADELSERDQDPRVRVRCGCGRTRPAYAMVDLRTLPAAVRGDQEWACDGCKTALWRGREPKIASRTEFCRLMGAPPAAVERVRAAMAWRGER